MPKPVYSKFLAAVAGAAIATLMAYGVAEAKHGGRIDNTFYDANGKSMSDAHVYDENGKPIPNNCIRGKPCVCNNDGCRPNGDFGGR
jgi:hypothetical protein